MAFLIIAYCFCSHAWERGFAIGNSGTGDPSTLHHEQTIFGEEIHTLITFVTGYWKTDHNVTLGQLHFIGPANSHIHALSMHCCITGLS